MKTKDYNFGHNFGHVQQHQASLLASLNILAFLIHTVLEWFDVCYQLLQETLSRREIFFDDSRSLGLDQHKISLDTHRYNVN